SLNTSATTVSASLDGIPVLGEVWFIQLTQVFADVLFGGTAAGGEVWTLVLNNSAATTSAYTVLAGQGIADIAQALAHLINTDPDAADFYATASGATLRIVSRSQTSFALHATITPVPSVVSNGAILA